MRLLRSGLLAALVSCLAVSCDDNGSGKMAPDADIDPVMDGSFACVRPESNACLGGVYYSCERNGEFLAEVTEDCRDDGKVCVEDIGCAVCRPEQITCNDNNVVECHADGQDFDVVEECNREDGFVCRDGTCRNLCEIAIEDESYRGCEFYSADLDNAAIAAGRDASAQQYAVVVSNPGRNRTDVVVEINEAPYGEEPRVREVAQATLLPGDLEVFELPRREIDGSSSNAECTPDDRTCPGDEVCVCFGTSSGDDSDAGVGGDGDGGVDGGLDGGMPDAGSGESGPCACRISKDASGRNDGTHSAVSSQAYRIRSTLPIIAYQFNPLDNVGVFSNDASLLIPTSAIAGRYTIVSWPQTIADGDVPERDFDSSRDDEDLRATLTILGTEPGTRLRFEAGRLVGKIVGGGSIPEMAPGDELELEIGPFDVVNLETAGLNADFTSSIVDANKPVSVFAGSEASDVPRFDTYAQRQCCADHLEEQLFPDRALGSRFIIARMPPRTEALNRAFTTDDRVAEVNEPEWVRVVAVTEGTTTVHTTLPSPDDEVTLDYREDVILRADQDFEMRTEGSKPVAVLQALPSQQAVGIPNEYPGGDPAILAVPPMQQWRQDYVFLTPDKYAFDFVIISAPRTAEVRLDGMSVDDADCVRAPGDGIERDSDDPPPDNVVYRCQLSFPDVIGSPNVRVEDGIQRDGVHSVVANQPVGVVVYGFDAFVSYAYGAGLNLKPLPR